MATSKIQRWLDLLAVLVGRRMPVPVDDIMEQVPGYRDRWEEGDDRSRESVRRMFERDKDQLRSVGIPLETRRFRVEGRDEAEGYLIPPGDLYLPYLRLLSSEEDRAEDASAPPGPRGLDQVQLDEEEAHTAISALRSVAGLPSFPFRPEALSALRKLTFDLDPALLEAPRPTDTGPDARVRILDRPGGADPQEALGALLDGLYDRKMVRFRYHAIGRDRVAEREVEPWGLLFQWGAWYLVARDPSREEGQEDDEADPAIRLFRVDRMDEVRFARSTGSGGEFDVPGTFDVRSYAGRQPWELEDDGEGSDLEVRVRFHPPLSLLAIRNGWGEAVENEAGESGEVADHAEEGAVVRGFQVRRLDPFLRWVLSMAGEAEVVSPEVARSGFKRMAAWIEDLYREAE